MKTKLLFFVLHQLADRLKGRAAEMIRNALLGEPVTLEQNQQLIGGLKRSIDLLPKRVSHYIIKQRYLDTISQAKHNTDHQNFDALLEFLDDGKPASYWGIVNSLCNDMYRVSAREMERLERTPDTIDFDKASLIRGVRDETLHDLQPVADYVNTITTLGISVSAAAVTSTLVATNALRAIRACPPDNPYYDACMERAASPVTKKYLPLDQDRAAGTGFAHILAPALVQGPRAIVGTDLAEIFEGALPGSSPIDIAIQSARFQSDRWFLPRAGTATNPTLSKQRTYWRLAFSNSSLDWVTLRSDRERLFIGFHEAHPPHDRIAVRTTSSRSPTWQWFIRSTDRYGVVMMLRNGTASSPLKNVLSTTKFWLRAPNASPGGRPDRYQAYWYLRPR